MGGRARTFAVLPFVWLGISLAGCTPVAPPAPVEVAPSVPALPAIEEGASSPADETRAATLLEQARDTLQAGDYRAARELARRIVSEYSRVAGSSQALGILAEAAWALGEAAEADAAATRFLTLLPPEAQETPRLHLLQGEARTATGDRVGATRALLEIPPGASLEIVDHANRIVRSHAPDLPERVIAELLDGSPRENPARAPLLVELALISHFDGDEEEAGRLARSALEVSAGEREARISRALLAGNVESVLEAAPILGAILPESGSPSVQQYAELISEGIQVAVANIRERNQQPVELRLLDDGGDPAVSAQRVRTLESSGALGIVGPLLGRSLEEMAGARIRPTPIVSPTVRSVPRELEGVYSLSTVDPGAALALARYAWQDSLHSVVVLYPELPERVEEAQAFSDEFQRLGGHVLRQIGYEPGSTWFEGHLREVEVLLPDALILPLPPEDIEVLAPQVTYYGMDTLGVQVLGTEGWTSPTVRSEVNTRHTDGVVATTSQPPGRESEGYGLFVERYETFHRKTLRSRIPALGYDAAAILLEALRTGVRSPRDVQRAVEQIRDLPGATGMLSIREGRVVRRQHLVRFQGRELFLISIDLN